MHPEDALFWVPGGKGKGGDKAQGGGSCSHCEAVSRAELQSHFVKPFSSERGRMCVRIVWGGGAVVHVGLGFRPRQQEINSVVASRSKLKEKRFG